MELYFSGFHYMQVMPKDHLISPTHYLIPFVEDSTYQHVVVSLLTFVFHNSFLCHNHDYNQIMTLSC